MYEINNDILSGPGVSHVRSPNTTGGGITPKFLIMHFTAITSASATVQHLCNPATKVSAHLVLDRDGSITQLLPFNTKGWHCGPSLWRGHSDLNNVSVGIEIVNYGPTPFMRDGLVHPRRPGEFNPEVEGQPSKWHHAAHPLEPGRMQYWQLFTSSQFDALDALTPLLVQTYKIREIAGHEEIAIPTGRKTDPGPAFPLDFYKQFADYGSTGSAGTYTVIVDDLNVRGGPGVKFAILTKLNKGDAVKVLTSGGETGWALVEVDRSRGYVNTGFLKKS